MDSHKDKWVGKAFAFLFFFLFISSTSYATELRFNRNDPLSIFINTGGLGNGTLWNQTGNSLFPSGSSAVLTIPSTTSGCIQSDANGIWTSTGAACGTPVGFTSVTNNTIYIPTSQITDNNILSRVSDIFDIDNFSTAFKAQVPLCAGTDKLTSTDGDTLTCAADQDTSVFLVKDGTRALTADWNTGSFGINTTNLYTNTLNGTNIALFNKSIDLSLYNKSISLVNYNQSVSLNNYYIMSTINTMLNQNFTTYNATIKEYINANATAQQAQYMAINTTANLDAMGYNRSITCIGLTGSAALCDGNDATGSTLGTSINVTYANISKDLLVVGAIQTGIEDPTLVLNTTGDTMYLNGTFNSTRLKGLVDCHNLDGGTDTDYCTDAAGGAGLSYGFNASAYNLNITNTLGIGSGEPNLVMNVSEDTLYVNGTINSTRFKGLLSCKNIDGGTDTDFCADATGTSTGFPDANYYVSNITVYLPNATIIGWMHTYFASDIKSYFNGNLTGFLTETNFAANNATINNYINIQDSLNIRNNTPVRFKDTNITGTLNVTGNSSIAGITIVNNGSHWCIPSC